MDKVRRIRHIVPRIMCLSSLDSRQSEIMIQQPRQLSLLAFVESEYTIMDLFDTAGSNAFANILAHIVVALRADTSPTQLFLSGGQ